MSRHFEELTICPTCKSIRFEEERFCGDCGAHLTTGMRPTNIVPTRGLWVPWIALFIEFFSLFLILVMPKIFQMPLLSISNALLVGLILFLLYNDLKDLFKLDKATLKICFSWSLLAIVFGGIGYIWELYERSVHGGASGESALVSTLGGVTPALLFIAVFPAIFEEILFRGVMMTRFEKMFNRSISLAMVSMIFAIIHQNIHSLLWLFCMGLFLGFLRNKSESIFPGMFAHFLLNGTLILLNYFLI